MSKTKNYITRKGFEKLKEEARLLFHEERPKIVETVAWAASNGDRSENADYQYGKRRLREIDRRLEFLAKRMDIAEIVDPATITSSTIVFGATVSIEDEEGVQKTYQIVGEDEVDTVGNKISWKSPIAKALLGKTLDQEVLIKRPKGDHWVVITDIKYI
ncbi:MAG: transcription elongation factor GreB [Bdellovibrionaceae bacterium]|nr:transcription elongation factor GreB [Pseudobdellovibrionaceae bacterium]